MLREVGKVVNVVNEDMVLISAAERLEVDGLVVPFVRHSIVIPGTPPIERDIIVPKGTLNILMDEGGGLYLAERYRENRQQFVNKAHGWLGLATETVPGDWSAKISAAGIRGAVTRVVAVGDLIAVEAP